MLLLFAAVTKWGTTVPNKIIPEELTLYFFQRMWKYITLINSMFSEKYYLDKR